MLSNEQLKKAGVEIFWAGVRAVDPRAAVLRHISRDETKLRIGASDGRGMNIDLEATGRVVVVGAGKATGSMAVAIEEILGDRLSSGLVVSKRGDALQTNKIETITAGHPIPDAASVEGARRALERVSGLDRTDLVLCLVSGGASSLWCAPVEGISLKEKQVVTAQLVGGGATIGEVNAVRKHLSTIKGGQLAKRSFPARVINVMLSDVIGDSPAVIGSGPAAPDDSTFADAKAALVRCRLWDLAPASVRRRIETGLAGQIAETPGREDESFSVCGQLLVGNNQLALRASAERARRLGFNTLVVSDAVRGDVSVVAEEYVALAHRIRTTGSPVSAPACVIGGGEPTVTVRGRGRGGRNQELALRAALGLAGANGVCVFSGGTDGTDGPTDAAGGVAFGDSVDRGQRIGMSANEFLARNDSYRFLDQLGDLVRTGPTGTNVMDIHLTLVSM